MKKYLFVFVAVLGAVFMSACESTDSDKPSRLPSRQTDGGDLPWATPASWEGGLPGMGGVGNPTSRY